MPCSGSWRRGINAAEGDGGDDAAAGGVERAGAAGARDANQHGGAGVERQVGFSTRLKRRTPPLGRGSLDTVRGLGVVRCTAALGRVLNADPN